MKSSMQLSRAVIGGLEIVGSPETVSAYMARIKNMARARAALETDLPPFESHVKTVQEKKGFNPTAIKVLFKGVMRMAGYSRY